MGGSSVSLGLWYKTENATGGGVLVSPGSYSNPFAVEVDAAPSALSTPDYTKFYATDESETSFKAHWAAVPGATKYYINVKAAGEEYPANPKYVTSSIQKEITGLNPNTAYRFKVCAANATQQSAWSKDIGHDVMTLSSSSSSQTASLSVVKSGFNGVKSFVVGETYSYVVEIANKSTTPWYGDISLKENGMVIQKWTGPIDKKSSVVYAFSYKPQTPGTKELSLCHQIANGVIIPFDYGGLCISVDATAPTSSSLSLKEAIKCTPATIEVGNPVNIATCVKNNESISWIGTIYIMLDGAAYSYYTYTIKAGDDQPFNCNWTPKTTGPHQIAVYHLTTNGQRQLVSAGGFMNPITVNVTGSTATPTNNQVKMKPITKELAPTIVTKGTEVYHHYKVTDLNDNPVKGITAVFSYEVGGQCKYIETSESDEDGILTLTLKTEDSDAVASPGQTVLIECNRLVDSNGQQVVLNGGNSNDHSVSLTVRRSSTFENVEKVKITIEPGIEFGTNDKYDGTLFGAKVSASVSGSFPISVSWKYDEEGNPSKYMDLDLGVKADFSGNMKYEGIDGGSLFKSINAGVGLDVEVGAKWGFSFDKISYMFYVLIYKICDLLPVSADWLVRKAAQKYKSWFEENQPMPDTKYSAYLSITGSGEAEFLTKLPAKKGLLKTVARLPKKLGISSFSVKGKGGFKWEFAKKKTDTQTHQPSYGSSVSYKVGLGGSVEGTFKNALFKDKSWWRNSKINKFFEKLSSTFFNFKKAEVSKSFLLELKEEEMYTSQEKDELAEISHEISLTSGYNIDTKNYKLFGKLSPINGSGNYCNAAKATISTKGAWANYLYNRSKGGVDGNRINAAFPAFNSESIMSSPGDLYDVWNDDKLSSLRELEVANPSQYKLSEAMKVEQTNTSSLGIDISYKVFDWAIAQLELSLGAEFELENRPTESYYSVQHKRFFPVVLRPSISVGDLVTAISEHFSGKTKAAYDDDEQTKEGITKVWNRFGEDAVVGAGSTIGPTTFTTVGTNHLSIQNETNGNVYHWVKRRHPKLAEQQQNDICTFTFVINDGVQNFAEGTNLLFDHFYPAGDLLGVTEQGDTLFVVSDVCELTAREGETAINATSSGKIKLDTTIGADDLTPFGLPANQPLDVYHADENSNVWHYVGPAGSLMMVDKMGAYMMGTSIKNDVMKPEIVVTLNEESGLLHFLVTDNIGVRLSTLQVFVNGELKHLTTISETNFELQLSDEEMANMITVYVTVNDLAGNFGRLFQVYHLDMAEDIEEVINEKNAGNVQITLRDNSLWVEGAEPNVAVSLFSFDGILMQQCHTDNNGSANIGLSNFKSGVYIVTLSNGKSMKFYKK